MCACICVFHFNFSVVKRNRHCVPQEDRDGDTREELPILPTNGDVQVVQNARKQKRKRTAFSNEQVDQLELAFRNSVYPDIGTRQMLASDLSINEDRIQVSFNKC